MSDLVYADDIVMLSSSYSEMQGLLKTVNRHAAAVGMTINASKTKVMSALIPGEQCQFSGSNQQIWLSTNPVAINRQQLHCLW